MPPRFPCCGAALRGGGSLALAAAVALLAGCSGNFVANMTEESQSSVTVQVVNNTPFRASFTIGGFDDLDRNPPGQVSFQQLRLEAGTSSSVLTFGCFRDLAIGSQKLLDRIIDTDSDEQTGFDEDAFTLGVSFSTAPAGTPGAALPDAGKADPAVVRLGVDYSCDDLLIFTMDQADDGALVIDFSVIPNESGDE